MFGKLALYLVCTAPACQPKQGTPSRPTLTSMSVVVVVDTTYHCWSWWCGILVCNSCSPAVSVVVIDVSLLATVSIDVSSCDNIMGPTSPVTRVPRARTTIASLCTVRHPPWSAGSLCVGTVVGTRAVVSSTRGIIWGRM